MPKIDSGICWAIIFCSPEIELNGGFLKPPNSRPGEQLSHERSDDSSSSMIVLCERLVCTEDSLMWAATGREGEHRVVSVCAQISLA